jgi:hypothetical protein
MHYQAIALFDYKASYAAKYLTPTSVREDTGMATIRQRARGSMRHDGDMEVQ